MNLDEIDDFGDDVEILRDFILLAYADTRKNLKQDYIGTSKNKKIFRVAAYSEEDKAFEQEQFEFDKEIVLILPGDYKRQGKVTYMVCLKDQVTPTDNDSEGDFYEIKHLDLESREISDIGKCDRLPFVYSLDKWQPAILLQLKNSTHACYYDKNRFARSPQNFPRLSADHSSAYIDINGDLRPDLVLMTEEDGEKFVEVLLSVNHDEYVPIQKLPLPQETGPLVFADFDADGLLDVAFVSHEGGEYFLTVMSNLGRLRFKSDRFWNERATLSRVSTVKEKSLGAHHYEPFTLSDTDFYSKVHISKFFPDLIPVLSTDKLHFGSKMPCGLMAVDVTLDSFPDLVLLMIDAEKNTHIRILQNKVEKGGTFEPLDFQPPAINGILSVSMNEHLNSRECLIVNHIHNGEYCLRVIDNPFSISRNLLTVTVLQPDLPAFSYGSVAPGIACRYFVDEIRSLHTGVSSTQSSFLHLQRPLTVLGLGATSYSGNMLRIGGPRTQIITDINNKVMEIKNTILPNSNLIAQPIKNSLKIELYLKLGNHVKNIVLVFAVVLFLNLILIVYSYFREERKVKESMKKEQQQFNFDAL